MVRVLVADDHAVVREGLRLFLDLQEGIEVVGEAEDGAAAVDLAGRLEPDVVLMDLAMPGMDGVAATREIRRAGGSRVLVLTSSSADESVVAALRAGADGYLSKDTAPPAVADAIRAVAAGEPLLEPDALRRLIRGLAAYRRRPEGTVTILFTDIVGSTRMVEELGDDRALELFERHRERVRAIAADHGGHEVSLQGDGFMFAFPGARSAIDCAIAVQADAAPLRLRVGLNTGEVITEEQGYFGRTVFLAARIADRAEPGQILISSTTRSLVPERAGREVCRCLLKGLAGEQPLYVVPPDGTPPPPLAEELTPRELEVLQLIAEGLPNKAIAARLHLSEKTVKSHVSNVLAKLGVTDRTQAALRAVRDGYASG
jgi:DNA-binding NarL/FixJ family response regulator